MNRRLRLAPWLFLAPALVVAVVFHVWPFLNTVVLSFTDASALGGGSFVGGENYVRLAQDPHFWLATRNTVLYVAVVVPLLVLLPLLLAVLVQPQIRGIGFFRSVFYSPVVASMVVVGLIWTWMLASDGIVNQVLEAARIIDAPLPFLTDSTLLLVSCMLVTVWKGLGYYMVVYLAALGNVSSEYHEAAQVDGANAARRFWSVTVPGVRPTMFLVGLLSAIAAMKVFAEVYVMSYGTAGPGGEARTLVYTIREVGLGLGGQIGYASAMSLALFVLTIGFSAGYLRAQRAEAR
ncbi:carbohydrate ABC transporter membrane protein 1 (CUT1 family) [Isoptericola sp. CG 20/1183]|uniref:Carbohydrate ABC transporter membrane protein 1 (CUT1 family) n=1 Tax=Isoptericola halotolerans TaxID=300560 RepID=A0ABX5EK23_9MICO|nr:MULTISPECIES: sugar ABC transporter permease [Isoptericola]PRZ08866.1 carbohydrate ABC transporter membrane protein 1 (CUT1 family) [Isoptericola halotolerans]PRZ10687.1 carbohydrate ABC transporter membrane protein 1 (CUT1 family) [Isoptericola sp. CG 20/1183]